MIGMFVANRETGAAVCARPAGVNVVFETPSKLGGDVMSLRDASLARPGNGGESVFGGARLTRPALERR